MLNWESGTLKCVIHIFNTPNNAICKENVDKIANDASHFMNTNSIKYNVLMISNRGKDAIDSVFSKTLSSRASALKNPSDIASQVIESIEAQASESI